MLLIGSQALKFYLNPPRPLVDYDYIATYEEIESWYKRSVGILGVSKFYPLNGDTIIAVTRDGIIEFNIAWPNSSNELILKQEQGIATLDMLYTIKMSHRYKKNSPHFLKTMTDIQLMRKFGARITPNLQEIYELRQKESYNYSHPKLNVSKKDFFSGDGINYVYDHDSIHEAVAILDKPAYKYYQPEGVEVNTSRELFFKQPIRTRWFGVVEEAYVLALERSQIPFEYKVNPDVSFSIALEKICTSITSGWFREFAWENYFQVKTIARTHKEDSGSYVNVFKRKVANGEVKLYNS